MKDCAAPFARTISSVTSSFDRFSGYLSAISPSSASISFSGLTSPRNFRIRNTPSSPSISPSASLDSISASVYVSTQSPGSSSTSKCSYSVMLMSPSGKFNGPGNWGGPSCPIRLHSFLGNPVENRAWMSRVAKYQPSGGSEKRVDDRRGVSSLRRQRRELLIQTAHELFLIPTIDKSPHQQAEIGGDGRNRGSVP